MNDEYICDDRPVDASERIASMTDEEMEKEFNILFSEYINKTQ